MGQHQGGRHRGARVPRRAGCCSSAPAATGPWLIGSSLLPSPSFGTGVSDFLHLDVHIPYAGTTLLWAVVLAAIFWLWQRSEGTLSIHSITTQRREAFYWATVFATFALGTALGDFTATSLNLGYLASGILFGVLILLPALAWWRFGLNSIAAFWMSYVLTRPLGASFADYISKPRASAGSTSATARRRSSSPSAVFVLVLYLAVARPDIQPTGCHRRLGPPKPSSCNRRGNSLCCGSVHRARCTT